MRIFVCGTEGLKTINALKKVVSLRMYIEIASEKRLGGTCEGVDNYTVNSQKGKEPRVEIRSNQLGANGV